MPEYENLLRGTETVRFGTRDTELQPEATPGFRAGETGKPRLVLDAIAGYHRKYRWL